MKITEVRAKRIKGNNRLKGIAAITIDECFVIHELRIIDGKNGLFVAMPSRRMPNGEYKDVAHPINTETRSMIEKEVLDTFNALPELEDDEPKKEEKEEEKETEEENEDEVEEEKEEKEEDANE
ncbi:MAG: septation regulator SpoVG [Candidatus Izimaplasma sp.]|nr:septation regulator SpoVG [Candidatus Izimaplasma bacterium]